MQLAHAWLAQHALNLHTLLTQSGIALTVMAALAFALGWLVAGRVLRPVRTITATARRISATSLHERLTLAGPDDEFKELAGTLNDLLARLETSFASQRHFVANASHELRTPLTLDRTLLQVALRNPGTTIQQWRTTGQELLESGIHQQRLLEALLTLASGEGGISNREPADLSESAAASLHATGPEAGRQRLRMEASLNPCARARRPRPDRAAGRQPHRQRRPPQHRGRHSPAHHRPAGRPRRHLSGQHRPGDPARRGHPAVPALRTPGHAPRQQRQRARARPVHHRRHRRRPRRHDHRARPARRRPAHPGQLPRPATGYHQDCRTIPAPKDVRPAHVKVDLPATPPPDACPASEYLFCVSSTHSHAEQWPEAHAVPTSSN